jgi:uncharacterized protein (DUF302 family)
MTATQDNGIVSRQSQHSVDETLRRVSVILHTKGVPLFALIDHSGEAAKAGFKMPATKLLIFGNPAAGTPLMLAAPTSAIDLPLKILITEDGEGRVWVFWNTAAYLQQRHGIPPELLKNIAVVEALVSAAVA